jgi:4-hydroxybenzoate polyprenyltransferase
VWLLALFGLGAIVMRGAGCTYNDIVDRDFDGRVARTADRPIPSGAVSVRQAALFLLAQLVAGLAILLALPWTAIWLGVLSLVLVFTYPLMKRVTWWPQFFLGLAFNWGALMGPAAVTDAVEPASLLLYAAGILWTLGYDTIYAHQDKEDDALVGVKSSARRLGARTRPALYAFYAGTVLLLAITGAVAGLAWPFYGLLAAGAAQLAWQAARVDTDDPQDCLAKFKSNRLFGWLILAGIVAGHVAAQ